MRDKMRKLPAVSLAASDGGEGERPAETGLLDKGLLRAQFQNLIAALNSARLANDATQSLMLDLRSHQIELEMQGHELCKSQEALETSRDHYASLFQDAPVGYVVFDAAGMIRAINRVAAALLGQPADRLAGCPFQRFLVGRRNSAFLAHLRAVFADAGVPPAAFDLVERLHDASRARVVRLRSIRRESAVGTECFTVLLDITAEHEAEERRLASDRLRQSVLDALPAQIAVLDPAGHILAVNRAWREFADENGGADVLRDAINLNYLDICERAEQGAGTDVPPAAAGIREVIQRRRPSFSVEYPCHSRQQQRWFLMNVAPLGGELNGAVVVHMDITERRQAEEAARRARDAIAQVDRLNAVGILAFSLIHELLQPLSAAGFFCNAASQLVEGPNADPRRLIQVIARIDEQVRRTGDIMERLRSFLRGRQMQKIVVSAEQVFRHALDLVQWFASDHGVQLRLVAPAELPEILTDPVQVEQVLVNLICNAVQAIDGAGSTRREVVVEVVPRPAEIELIVTDSGPGLPANQHERLFNIFESTRDASLGLGLAISRAIAEALGGRLWAEPNPSEGAEFHFTLPLNRV
ncbi:PAS domain-containing sensor histidine kinase [Thiocystis violascens]|uniref:histidine kinase n=1 Tax=Thiocystis violascens (strain ATCC 17096 / DSM 198 / 6111) TaxID=765911 RepID=I3YFY4_THIV6|nr:PAS domain-containing sensor histidine kinase [Thiocystis violascens]AFL75902.1 PAS/PAC sensor signal transduction histidine kinase [Thiocystis violascens DSM 198]